MRAVLAKVPHIVCLWTVCFGEVRSDAAVAKTFIPISGRQVLTNGVYFSDRTRTPEVPSAPVSLGDSPPMATNFYALGWDQVALSHGDEWQHPPDTHGAVSKDFCMTMLNTEVGVKTRTGQEVQRVSRFAWWKSWTNSEPSLTNIYRVVDPRVVYDPFHERWIGTCFVNNDPLEDQLRTAGILVGVSTSSHPTNAWHTYRIYSNTNGGTNFWIDQPTIGYNKDWIVIHGNNEKHPGGCPSDQMMRPA